MFLEHGADQLEDPPPPGGLKIFKYNNNFHQGGGTLVGIEISIAMK